jgi:hypothetical protein
VISATATAAAINYKTAKSLFEITTLAIVMQWENKKQYIS